MPPSRRSGRRERDDLWAAGFRRSAARSLALKLMSKFPSPDLIIDVRALAPELRHGRLARSFEDLGGGESLCLVDDHDLAPFFEWLLAEYPSIFDWTYEERGPRSWRARVDRLVP